VVSISSVALIAALAVIAPVTVELIGLRVPVLRITRLRDRGAVLPD
jgi:hypothetical protein